MTAVAHPLRIANTAVAAAVFGLGGVLAADRQRLGARDVGGLRLRMGVYPDVSGARLVEYRQ